MNSKVTTITKYDSIAVFSLGIVTNGASRILRRHGIIGFGYILGLYGGEMRAVNIHMVQRGVPSQSTLSPSDP